MSNDDYIPIECSLHSEYELAIMHKTKLMLTWKNDDHQEQSESILPVDLIVSNKQEYLKIVTADHQTHKIRLDKIITFKPEN